MTLPHTLVSRPPSGQLLLLGRKRGALHGQTRALVLFSPLSPVITSCPWTKYHIETVDSNIGMSGLDPELWASHLTSPETVS